MPDPPSVRVTPAGLKDAPRPLGTADVRFTFPVKPLMLVIVMVEVPDEPTSTFNEPGVLEIVKPGSGFTIITTFTE